VNRRWGIALIIMATLISIGRVMVGVHYPTDVLGGAVLGALAALIVHLVTHMILRTHHRADRQL
jgi:undecaprenyl-diphosphatase